MTAVRLYTHEDIKSAVHELLRQMYRDNWRPDYVVGLTRGGLLPATMISHYLDIPMHTLKVCLRDNHDVETNAWMAEEAFGYISEEERPAYGGQTRWDPGKRRKILIVDDINDSGATFEWIKKDWMGSCLPSESLVWDTVWGKSVRFATLVENSASDFDTNYAAEIINKSEEDVWCVFPWENWWK